MFLFGFSQVLIEERQKQIKTKKRKVSWDIYTEPLAVRDQAVEMEYGFS